MPGEGGGGREGAVRTSHIPFDVFFFSTPSLLLPKRGASERTHEPCTSRNPSYRPKYKCHDKSSPSCNINVGATRGKWQGGRVRNLSQEVNGGCPQLLALAYLMAQASDRV